MCAYIYDLNVKLNLMIENIIIQNMVIQTQITALVSILPPKDLERYRLRMQELKTGFFESELYRGLSPDIQAKAQRLYEKSLY